jgi:hypothetical protein
MKNLLAICSALIIAFGAANARAADVTGSWTTTMQTMDGNNTTITFNFKQDGATLTGTVAGPIGDPIPITNGKIDGDKFTFDVSFNGITIHHDATVTGDSIKMSTKTDSGDFPARDLTLTRVKPDAAPSTPAPATPPATTPQPQAI